MEQQGTGGVLPAGTLKIQTVAAGGVYDAPDVGDPLIVKAGETLPEGCSLSFDDGRTKVIVDVGRDIGHIGKLTGDVIKVGLTVRGEEAPAAPLDLEVTGKWSYGPYAGSERNTDATLDSDAPGDVTLREAGIGDVCRDGTGAGKARIEDTWKAHASRSGGPGNAEVGAGCGPKSSATVNRDATGDAICEAADGYANHYGEGPDCGTAVVMDGKGSVVWTGRPGGPERSTEWSDRDGPPPQSREDTMPETHPSELGQGTAVGKTERAHQADAAAARLVGDEERQEPGADAKLDRLRSNGGIREGETMDDAFNRLVEETGIGHGSYYVGVCARFATEPAATLERLAETASSMAKAAGQPPPMPDRGSGHRPKAAEQQQERGPAR